MTEGKLIIRNVRKNIQDYMIYFLTLTVSVSMFYAFNSIQTQPALNDLDATKQLLSDQLGILLSALSVVVAIVLAFLILYANQFLLKRRKKELGIYTLLGMEKGKISRIFAGETLCVGILSLVFGLILGLLLSQGLSIFSLRLFAIDMSKFQIVFSMSALKKTIGCFVLIFLIVMIFNVRTVSSVKLIDLLTASRKNECHGTKEQSRANFFSCAFYPLYCFFRRDYSALWYTSQPRKFMVSDCSSFISSRDSTFLLFCIGSIAYSDTGKQENLSERAEYLFKPTDRK